MSTVGLSDHLFRGLLCSSLAGQFWWNTVAMITEITRTAIKRLLLLLLYTIISNHWFAAKHDVCVCVCVCVCVSELY